MLRILLARHGQTNFNRDQRIQGALDTSQLTCDGIQQVSALGFWLATSGETLKHIDRTWCSPMVRARQSLAAVRGCAAVAGCPLPQTTIRDDLREIELHQWEGRRKADIASEDPEGWAMWKCCPEQYVAPSGESPLLNLWNRAQDNWKAIRAEESRVSFVMGHGALGRSMLGTALGLAPSSFVDRRYEFENACCIEIEWPSSEDTASRWRLRYPSESSWETAAEARAHQETVASRVSDSDFIM